MFGKHWEEATAVVVAARITGNRPDGTVTGHEIVVDVYPSDGAPFRARAAEPRIATDFRAPSVGANVRVEFDAKSGHARMAKNDPATSRKALVEATRVSLDDVLRGTPGTTPDPVAGAQAQFQQLLDAGVFGGRSTRR